MVLKALSISVVTLFIGGCFGGGGGGGGSSASISQFVKYSETPAGTTIAFTNAQTQEMTYTYNVGTSNVTGIGVPTSVKTTGSVSETYDASGDLTSSAIISSEGTSLSYGAGDTQADWNLNPKVSLLTNAAGSEYILYSNPTLSGYDYQNYGVWVTGGGTGSGKVGSLSVGLVADSSIIPTSGTATYTGTSAGFYAGDTFAPGDSAHTDYFVDADVAMTANFAAGTITFATSNSVLTNDFVSTYSDPSGVLDLTGTLAISGNQFTGVVTNGASLSGHSTGRFYGDTTEVGGTFLVQESGLGSNKDSYIGGFGAKQSP